MDRLSPIIDTFSHNKPKEQVPIDRFIPDRRMVLSNYDKHENPEELLLAEEDPQNISITEIYN